MHKGDKKRDALGIVIKPRRGAPQQCRNNWGHFEYPYSFAQRLQLWIKAFRDETLPDRLAYQVARLTQLIPRELPDDALFSELKCLIERKERAEHGNSTQTQEEVKNCLRVCLHGDLPEDGTPGQYIIGPAALEAEWLVARWFAKNIFAGPRLPTQDRRSSESPHGQ